MHLRWALLALLEEEASHGYLLVKRFNERLGPVWHPNVGQVYQVLHELERRGWVTGSDDTCGARLRRRFRLTARGERALRAWLARRPGWPEPPRHEIFVRLLATERHGAAAVQAQLERQEAEWRRWLCQVREHAPKPAAGSVTSQLAREAALDLGEAQLRWLARCREVVAERDLGTGREGVSSRASG